MDGTGEGGALGLPRAQAAWDQHPFFSSTEKLRDLHILVVVHLAVAV